MNPVHLLADIGPEHLALLIPILAMMIPIIAIMTGHQRKMAEVIHRNQFDQGTSEIFALRQEVQELKQIVHQQTIAMDNLIAAQTRMATNSDSIETRLSAH